MRIFLVLLLSKFVLIAHAQNKLAECVNLIPDSIKAISVLSQVKVKTFHPKKLNLTMLRADDFSIHLTTVKNRQKVSFYKQDSSVILSKGVNVLDSKNSIYSYINKPILNEYKLLITSLSDSSLNLQIYSGYIFLADEKKWKFIGSYKKNWDKNNLKYYSTVYVDNKIFKFDSITTWLQRSNGSWKNMQETPAETPVVNLMTNIDSLQQAATDEAFILQLIRENKTDAKATYQGIYYKILQQGTGKKVNLTDTVTVHYKGYLLTDGTVFDQTKNNPANFPLNRLIKGWQIGVPLLNVGGKIKIIIPSGLAYGIRTRSPKIPPNSILVFEIEVLEAK